MFAPRGFSGSELGDVEVIAHEGVLHLFHLALPNHDVIGHAISRDGIVWEARPDVLSSGDPGAFDDDQLWTMGVVERGGRFYMLYTALSRADEGRVQRVGLAVSDDLEHWEKHPEPVSEAALPHYRQDHDGARWVSWRDPKPVVLADGRVHAVVCARDPNAPTLRQGIVGHIVSDDMSSWETLPPLFATRRHVELECPQLFPFAGRLYLTASILEERTQRYWLADDLAGPFSAPDDNRFLPAGHYAARVCEVGDAHWAFAFHDAGGSRGLRDRFLPAPLVLDAAADGRLSWRRTKGWDARAGAAETIDPSTLEARYAARRTGRDGSRLWSDEGAELFFRPMEGDLLVRTELQVDAPFVGLAVAHDTDGSGTLLELDRGARRARVLSRGADAHEDGRPWFRERVLSEGAYRPAARHALEIIRAGGELIVSIDGEVVVSTVHHASPGADGIGIFVDSGRVVVDSLSAAPIRL